MRKTFSYDLPIEVIKFLSNLACIRVFGETLVSIGKVISLKDYDQNEVNRCYSDFLSFMINAKNNNRKVSVV